MNKQDIEQILKNKTGSKIGIGVPNINYPDRLFFYFGILISIDDEHVILDSSKEGIQIPIDNIVSIRKEVFHV